MSKLKKDYLKRKPLAGCSNETGIAIAQILMLVEPSSPDIVSYVSAYATKKAKKLEVVKELTDEYLAAFSSDVIQDLLHVVLWNWIELNINLMYLRAREAIAIARRTLEAKPDKKKAGRTRDQEAQILAELQKQYNAKHSQVLSLRAESDRTISGSVKMLPSGDGGQVAVRELDVIEISWECSWQTMRSRM